MNAIRLDRLTETRLRWGDFTACGWLLPAPDGGVFALTRLEAGGRDSEGRPLIFLPGMFSNRHFWVSPQGIGLAAYLSSQGFDCWLVERRGTGLAAGCGTARQGLEELIRCDLPLAQATIAALNPSPAVWVGHSFGGVAIARAMAGPLVSARPAGLVLFASQFEVGKPMLRWPGRVFVQGLSRLCGQFPARRLGLGPENEPVAAMDDACRWTTRGQKDTDIQRQLANIHCPVLGMVGAADRVDPAEGCEKLLSHMSSTSRQLVVAGKRTGFNVDFDHPGIVVSREAREAVWPRVADWLQKL